VSVCRRCRFIVNLLYEGVVGGFVRSFLLCLGCNRVFAVFQYRIDIDLRSDKWR